MNHDPICAVYRRFIRGLPRSRGPGLPRDVSSFADEPDDSTLAIQNMAIQLSGKSNRVRYLLTNTHATLLSF